MNEIDPASRFSREAVQKYKGDDAYAGRQPQDLNGIARKVAMQYRRDTMSPVMVSGILRLVEFALLALSGLIVYASYVGVNHMFWAYPTVVLATAFGTVIVLEIFDCYQVSALLKPWNAARVIMLTWAAAFAALALIGFLAKMSEEFSRGWFTWWFVTGLALLLSLRLVLMFYVRKWARNGRMERRAVIVGGGKVAEKLIRAIEQQPYNDIRICGIFDDRDDTRSPTVVAGYPKLGTIDQLIEFGRIARIDMLIVSLPLTAESRVLAMLKKLWVLPVDIRLSAHANQLHFRPRSYSFLGAVPMLDIFDKPINNWDSVAKRAFDIVFSLLGLVVFSPIMIGAAIAIKLDSKGPVFFKQKRHGFNNEVIDVYKFRSMYVDQQDPTAKNAVRKGDPRVTRVGRIIRKTSIDELPQFFNSLIGNLSLIGPRPHAISAQSHNKLYHEVVDGYFARHRVKPGVTGWAQINGLRGEIDHDDKIKARTEYDLFYIENWSLWFDLKILFLTPVRLLNTENAY